MQALMVMPIDGAQILAPGTLSDCCHDPVSMHAVHFELHVVKRFPGKALVGLNADYAEH